MHQLTVVPRYDDLERTAIRVEAHVPHRAERAVVDAEEAAQDDDWGASERGYLTSELKQMAAEERARAEANARRSKKTIREIHIAEVKAAKLRLEDLRTQMAKMESDDDSR